MTDNKKLAANKTVLLVFIVNVAAALIVSKVLIDLNADALTANLVLSLTTQVFCLGILPFTLFNVFRKKRADGGETFGEYISFSAPAGGAMRRIVWITICAMTVSAFISALTQAALSFLPMGEAAAEAAAAETEAMSFEMFLLGLVTGCLFPAIFEEFTFRGILLGAYKDSPKVGVILSAAMFSLMHMNIDQTFYTFFIGVILAVLTLKSRSIIPAMTFHFLNNAASLVTAYALSFLASSAGDMPAAESLPVESVPPDPAGEMIAAVIAIGFAVAVAALMIYGLISGIKKINADNPVDWDKTSANPEAKKTRLTVAAAVVIGVAMTALTVVFRML
ncbi:MAG: CPBP family intramembrane metalloprotease [Clostridiales bacterium]|jgi:membrane protease YdiL (CAAX protease family)|nr:CPBP family intramembrane metalloprotease [Clostridiales bacterium]